ncbi:MAG TPA: hypothetical protein RMF84_15400 [Polyangiaceae bacterium LLY-WYZ-14_1]|nr:hypothetical protein [Polyangiaceae bacterium LLY-WYZ-14_1]
MLDYQGEPEDCGDSVDNDLDGRVDCVDPDCDGPEELCDETRALCEDDRDNDGDGLIDADDFGCWLEPRRIDVVRCESAVETDLTRDDFLNADDWIGGRLVASDEGLRGPARAGETSVVWRGLVTGAYFGRLSGDPGLALDVTVGLERGWENVEVELYVADGVPRSEGTDLVLRLDERDGHVDVELVTGEAAFFVGTFDFAATLVRLRLRAANPVLEGCRECAFGTRVLAEAESSEHRSALEPLVVHDRPLPVLGAPPCG